MAHDTARLAEVRDWLDRARQDLRAADLLLTSDEPLPDVAVFHCQQAAEKSRPLRKTHNLEELGEQCLGVDAGLEELIDRAVPLTEYAWRFRYPGEQEQVEPDEAEGARELAGEVYDGIAARVPREARP